MEYDFYLSLTSNILYLISQLCRLSTKIAIKFAVFEWGKLINFKSVLRHTSTS